MQFLCGVLMRLFLLLLFCFLSSPSAFAAVDIVLRGHEPVRIEDVYQQNGQPYVAIEDALSAVGLSGYWDSIRHVFRIKTPRGWAEISPASGYFELGDEFYPLKDKPRFIDGRLRVTEHFIINQLAQLTGRSIYLRNLDPDQDTAPPPKRGLERFFAFLLNKKNPHQGPLIRAVAIDPGHGGLDAGVIAPSGYKEKELNLEIAEKLAKKIKMRLGIPVYLSRDADYELTPEQRRQAAAREDVDLWILVHAQSSFSAAINGVTLFVRPEEIDRAADRKEIAADTPSESLLLAEQLVKQLRAADIVVRGIFPSSRLSLGRGNLPTVQIELGYLSHPPELERLRNSDYQNQLVQALYDGIRDFAQENKEQTDAIQ